ncbi:HEAT repeat domain-containing protein [Gordonia hongkongensis]|uniref:HEAT repeat domain-containing protein n=1 Tax=Gordonia hongkongensis TaxID=1701090 RepID=A0ABT6BQS4_9ACTN|nr:HEAT repeat domain-containing protein [Gordonia hongkongensis]MDF6100323.1 HEAT repeat domain-containing protein [Gordonia hongkongensis]
MLIGEVAQHTGLSSRMLRHYDSLGLVRPTGRTPGGYREYSDADLERLMHVESLRSLGLSLREVGRALDDPEFAPDTLMDRLIDDTKARMAADAQLLARLQDVRRAGPSEWSAVLGVVNLLRAVESENAAHRQTAAMLAGEVRVSGESLADALLKEPDPNVAGALRWALAQRPGGIDRLAEGAANPDPAIRRRAVTALAAVEETPQVRSILDELLDDSDAAVRRIAALTLGRRGVAAAVDALVELIAAGDRDVEAAEILAGHEAHRERIVDLLVDRLGADPDAAVRSRLVQALAEIPGTASTSALQVYIHDADDMVARTAVVILDQRPVD